MKRTPIQWPAAGPTDKTYWRSLDQLADTPEFREFLHREFPAGASELSSPISRRSFMTLMGASVALAGLAGCRRPEEKILPYTKAPEDMVLGLPNYYATALSLGSAVYGVLVESNEGRPTKIEGNPRHPASLGATNAYTQAMLLDLYDPDRSTAPMRQGKDREEIVAPAKAEGHGEGHGEHEGGHGAAAPTSRTFDANDVTGYLGPRRAKLAAQKGQGLHILSGALTSPTLLRLREQARAEWPMAQWHTWEPVCEDNIRAGSRLAFGDDFVTHLDLEAAEVVLALDSDLLGMAPDAVRSAKLFARRRRPEKSGDRMNRLYVVESAWTVTGTNADHRLRLKPSEVGAFAAALAGAVAKQGVTLPPGLSEKLPATAPASVDAKFLAALSSDLVKNRGKVAISVGANQPAEVHALVHALHEALGANGSTVSYTKAADAGRPLDGESLKALAAALDRGEVDTLVVLGGNPVHDAPVDLQLGDKIKASQASGKTALVHLGVFRDETALVADLHIPRAHALESWGDARSVDGTASVVQPLIAPLWKGWSDIELVSYVLTGKLIRGYELVRDTWRGVAIGKMPAPTPPPAPEPIPAAPPAKGGKAAKGVDAKHALAAGGLVAKAKGPLDSTSDKADKAPISATITPAPAAPAVPAPGEPGAAAPGGTGGATPPLPPGIPQQSQVLFFEHYWRKSLHDGLITETAFERVRPALKADVAQIATKLAAAPAANAFEVQFVVDNTIYDGRFVNNGWLQELPDPVTKLVWDNAAILSMDTAKKLGVEKNDIIKITVGGRSVEAPVFVQPGQASDVVTVSLGYGRDEKATGRIGKGAGFDAYRIRQSGSLGFDGAALEKTGKVYDDQRDLKEVQMIEVLKIGGLVTTQDHFALEGRPIIREASLTRFTKNPEFAQHAVHHPPLVALWDEHAKVGQQWGMAIDLSSCVGCGACTVACQAENNIPIVGKAQVRKGREMHWIRVDRYFSFAHQDELTDSNTEVSHQPLPCMHCENAPCENVCPVAATVHSSDGLNDMVYNRCVGTRYCANNCPWKVRRFNYMDWRGDVDEVAKLKYNPDVTLRSRGVIEKCTYCVQRIRGAQRDAKLKLAAGKVDTDHVVDGGITPACAQVCPADAITFGDIMDPKSRISKLKGTAGNTEHPRNYVTLAELNAKPRTSYLARIRNPHPDLAAAEVEEGHGGGHHGAGAAPGAHEAPAGGTAPAEHTQHEAGASHS